MEIAIKYRIIYTAIVLITLFFIRFIVNKSLKKIHHKFDLHKARLAVITKLTNVLLYVTTIVFVAFVWGVEEKQLLIYISSFLTLLGIAFFAQWSILSNITAGLILFINYPVKIGSTITIMEKDNDITGEISDIGIFFITLKTEKKDFITLPNSIILQRMVRFS
jgi:small-conductance mechanosensitive channel